MRPHPGAHTHWPITRKKCRPLPPPPPKGATSSHERGGEAGGGAVKQKRIPGKELQL